jgi:hypothetical protein
MKALEYQINGSVIYSIDIDEDGEEPPTVTFSNAFKLLSMDQQIMTLELHKADIEEDLKHISDPSYLQKTTASNLLTREYMIAREEHLTFELDLLMAMVKKIRADGMPKAIIVRQAKEEMNEKMKES